MKAPADNTAPALDMQKLLWGGILAACVTAALTLGFYFAYFFRSSISSDPSDWGTLGDYFGGLMNPVVSFVTLLVAYAVWKQQREELKATKEALEVQAKTAEQQRQEQRFFDLYRVYNQTLGSYTSNADGGREHRGKEAITDALYSLPDFLKSTLRHGFNQITNGNQLTPSFVVSEWSKNSHRLQRFNVYIRVVFRLLEEAEPLLGEQHKRYVGIFQSQLSDDEVRLIGLLSWIDPRWAGQRALLEKYYLLKHFPEGPFRSDLMDLIGTSAFSEENATPC